MALTFPFVATVICKIKCEENTTFQSDISRVIKLQKTIPNGPAAQESCQFPKHLLHMLQLPIKMN